MNLSKLFKQVDDILFYQSCAELAQAIGDQESKIKYLVEIKVLLWDIFGYPEVVR